ncbi:transcription factor PAP1-domain-containing protein [Jimgerdemannia flammicorona]|uniref:Transcription factor PAP1-domain-containing protein n=1 Tax=Jimgerdemannia flammicorona TaxID=994334 RepID=A0A433QD93_9FUNG|nr:transcription factor PAP1-domain-containing protein [Jimgerdemannia flammicorona]
MIHAAVANSTPLACYQYIQNNDYSDSILHSEEDTKSQDGQEQKQGPKKPGRKPLTTTPTSLSNSDPKQKRKAQNRAAQRAFRERKERYVKELEERIKELESSHNASSSVLQAENQQLKSLVQKLEAENYVLKGANFTFDFPIQKAHLKLGNLAVVSDSAKISQEDETTVPARDPWTPPSSNESDSQDSEPASPVSSGAYGSPDPIHAYTDDSSPQSDMQKSSPAMPSVFAFDDEVSGSSHPTPPSSGCEKTMKDGASFCDKLEEEVCGPSVSAVDQLLSEPIFDNTGALNASISNANLIPIIGNGTGTTSFHERSALFTEFRDPSLYHNTFAESVPIPPLFQDDLDDYGTYPPMLTPRDEVKTEPLGGGTVSGEFAPTPANAQRFQHIPHQDTLDPEKKLISCTKVWETISEHPRFEEFDVDELCSALKAKAKCSGHGPVVAEDALKEVLARLDRGNTQ